LSYTNNTKAKKKASVEMRAPKGVEIEEVLRCGRDPVYFINKYCKIQHPQRGTIPFKTYPFQDRCVRDFLKFAFNIVLKSRQLGLSTVTAGFAVWLALFRRDQNILVMAQKLRTAKNFIKKVHKMLAHLPPWLRLCNYEQNQQEVRFDNGSQIVSIPTTDDAGRSEALSLLIVDEAAIIRNFEEIWGSIYPTLSEGGRAIVLSTPNGVGGQYHDLWVNAEAPRDASEPPPDSKKIQGIDPKLLSVKDDNSQGRNEFHPIRLPWDVHPEHDQSWFNKQLAKLGPRKSAQELLCDFLSSGETFLQAYTMDWIAKEVRTPLRVEGPENNVWIFDEPIPNHKYVLGADVSRGDAKDFSTFVIIDMATGVTSAEYKGKLFPDQLADLIDRYGKRYNNALAAIEANTFGNHTLTDLKKLGYPNIFYRTAPAHSVENYYPSNKDRWGFDTQAGTRMEALAKLEDSMRCHHVHPRSNRLYEEFQSFVYTEKDNGSGEQKQKPQAKKGKHDDLVMACAIACWVYRTYFENYRLSFLNNPNGSQTTEKPLFMYMSRDSRPYQSRQKPLGAPMPAAMHPRLAVSLDKPMSPQSVELDPHHLKWLLR
jgi:hypothetical protein